MKKIIVGFLCFCFFIPQVSRAQIDDTKVRIRDINAETQRLQKEIDQLRQQIHRIEQKPKKRVKRCARPRIIVQDFFPPSMGGASCFNSCNPPNPCNPCASDEDDTLELGFADNANFNDFARMWGNPRNLLLLAAAGATVTTSPFLGLRSAFDASDLIVNLPTMNEDLRFLKEHVLVNKKLRRYGLKLPDRPIIELGGKIEGIVFAQRNFNEGKTSSDIDLSNARLDVLVEVSKGVHGFFALNMDTSAFDLLNDPRLGVQLAGVTTSRILNSRVFVSRAFVTVGDLEVSPLYFTIGQMFVPFGRYASNMVSSTLTVQLARTNERAILFGLYKDGLYGSIYGFRGEVDLGSSGINVWGTNWGYEKKWKCSSLNIGVGYISNIADSAGFQVTGAAEGFFGFGFNHRTEMLIRAVPAWDIHGEFAYNNFNLFAEYIWTANAFDVLDLNFNGHGARPTALNLELAYNFKVFDKPASVAVGYETTSESLALILPESSILAAFNISIWKNTIASLEYRYDRNYDDDDFAGGRGAIPSTVFSTGGSRNTLTFQFGVYF